jgi:phycocyanin-associated rod protein
MLGQSVLGGRSGSPANARVFVYEVTGLRQNDQNDRNSYPFRTSSSVFIQVPYNRMNEEMLRITRMGGTIVNIRPLVAEANNNAEASDE